MDGYTGKAESALQNEHLPLLTASLAARYVHYLEPKFSLHRRFIDCPRLAIASG
jgi:hypothetical protein